jgi:hypothetical protein
MFIAPRSGDRGLNGSVLKLFPTGNAYLEPLTSSGVAPVQFCRGCREDRRRENRSFVAAAIAELLNDRSSPVDDADLRPGRCVTVTPVRTGRETEEIPTPLQDFVAWRRVRTLQSAGGHGISVRPAAADEPFS